MSKEQSPNYGPAIKSMTQTKGWEIFQGYVVNRQVFRLNEAVAKGNPQEDILKALGGFDELKRLLNWVEAQITAAGENPA